MSSTDLKQRDQLITACSSDWLAVVVPSEEEGSFDWIRIRLLSRQNNSSSFDLTYRIPERDSEEQFRVQSLQFGGQTLEYLVAHVTRHLVVVWNVVRGVVVHPIRVNASQEQILSFTTSTAVQLDEDQEDQTSEAKSPILHVLVRQLDDDHHLRIHEYDLESGRLLRKIKAGKWHGAHHGKKASKDQEEPVGGCLTTTAQNRLVMAQANRVRVLDAASGKTLHKHKMSKSVSSILALAMSGEWAVLLGRGSQSQTPVLSLLHLETGQEQALEVGDAAVRIDNICSVDFYRFPSEESNNTYYYLLVNGSLLLGLALNNAKKKSSWTIRSRFAWTSDNVDETVVYAPSSLDSSTSNRHQQQRHELENHALLGILQRRGEQQQTSFQLVPPHDWVLQQEEESSAKEQEQVIMLDISGQNSSPTTATSDEPESASSPDHKRRKLTATATSFTTLGPAHVGGAARSVTEGGGKQRDAKTAADDPLEQDEDGEDDDVGAVSIAERLAQIQQALDREEEEDEDEEEGAPKESTKEDDGTTRDKQPLLTTESLSQLLQQALQASDDVLLEQALEIRDERLIDKTLEQLSSALPLSVDDDSDLSSSVLLSRLLTALTSRLALKPTRAHDLTVWISAVLMQLAASGGGAASCGVEPLQALYNLLNERTQVFSDLLQLEGRLSLMQQQQAPPPTPSASRR